MATTVHLIRHGESTFNSAVAETGRDNHEQDARLSALGHRQVAETGVALAGRSYDLVVTSPLTRALQTALGLFYGRDVAILVEALPRERVEHSCDLGRSPEVLAKQFSGLVFDHLDDPWWYVDAANGVGVAVEPESVVKARCDRFRAWLSARPEQVIAVVGHGTFFHHLSGLRLANCELFELDL